MLPQAKPYRSKSSPRSPTPAGSTACRGLHLFPSHHHCSLAVSSPISKDSLILSSDSFGFCTESPCKDPHIPIFTHYGKVLLCPLKDSSHATPLITRFQTSHSHPTVLSFPLEAPAPVTLGVFHRDTSSPPPLGPEVCSVKPHLVSDSRPAHSSEFPVACVLVCGGGGVGVLEESQNNPLGPWMSVSWKYCTPPSRTWGKYTAWEVSGNCEENPGAELGTGVSLSSYTLRGFVFAF